MGLPALLIRLRSPRWSITVTASTGFASAAAVAAAAVCWCTPTCMHGTLVLGQVTPGQHGWDPYNGGGNRASRAALLTHCTHELPEDHGQPDDDSAEHVCTCGRGVHATMVRRVASCHQSQAMSDSQHTLCHADLHVEDRVLSVLTSQRGILQDL